MRSNTIRRFGSSLLISTMLLGAITVFPAASFAQSSTNSKQQESKEKKSDKKKAEQAQQKSGLAVNEDPSMIGKRNINKGTDSFFGWFGGSKEKEAAIGRQLSLEIEQQAKLIDDPIVTEYVNRVGQNIVLHSDAKVPFTIKVIDSDEVNAFALPGGYFYVNKGLILAADNEAELAGVMAHEIAHVAARHAMENAGKQQVLGMGVLAGIIFGGPILSTVLQNAGGLGEALAFFKFSRGAEQEADRLGVQYLYAAGYDPTAMATMFEKLAAQNKKKPGSLAKLFSSHPQSLDRRDTSLALVARFPEREEYVISTSEYQRVKARLLRFSNAKAATAIDIDEGEPGRPTLKRRAPDTDNPSGDQSGTSSSSDSGGPPQLKRRNPEPETKASPSPSPEN